MPFLEGTPKPHTNVSKVNSHARIENFDLWQNQRSFLAWKLSEYEYYERRFGDAHSSFWGIWRERSLDISFN
jgi:hypothetical protein